MAVTPGVKEALIELKHQMIQRRSSELSSPRGRLLRAVLNIIGRLWLSVPSDTVLNASKVRFESAQPFRNFSMQHDASEFFLYICDALESDDGALQGTLWSPRNILAQTVTVTTCNTCHQSGAAVLDPVKCFILEVPEMPQSSQPSVQSLMNSKFVAEELSSENVYDCSTCSQKEPAKRTMSVSQWPSTIVMNLSRSRLDIYTGETKKNLTHVHIDKGILCPTTDGNFVPYRIRSIIVHYGPNVESGHYITYVHVDNRTWYKINDAQVDECTLDELRHIFNFTAPNRNPEATPYLLFYEKDV